MANLVRLAQCNSERPDDGESYWVSRISVADVALDRFFRQLDADGHDVNGKGADDVWDTPGYPASQTTLRSSVAFPAEHIPRIVELLTAHPAHH